MGNQVGVMGHSTWPRTIAEVVLIILGIILAFSADRWWDSVQRRDLERDYLARLTDDFAANQRELSQGVARQDTFLATAHDLLTLIAAGRPHAAEDSIAALLTVVLRAGPISPRTAAYDELKSSGNLLLLRQDTLRRMLASFDALVQNDFATADIIWRDEWLTRVRPYIEANLSPEIYLPTRTVGTTTIPPIPMPHTRGDLSHDREFWNLVVHRMIVANGMRHAYTEGLRLNEAILRYLEATRE